MNSSLAHSFRQLGLVSLLVLLATTSPLGVSAQTATYNFADIPWGITLSEVHERLVAAGFTGCELRRRLECRYAKSCSCSFDGPSIQNGNAIFENNSLIYITMALPEVEKAKDRLYEKYGKPIQQPSSIGGASGPKLAWKSGSGDLIVLDGGLLDYYSGAYLKRRSSEGASGLNKF